MKSYDFISNLVLAPKNVEQLMDGAETLSQKPHNLLDRTIENLGRPILSKTENNCLDICNRKKAQSSTLIRIYGDQISYDSSIPSQMQNFSFLFITENEDDNSLRRNEEKPMPKNHKNWGMSNLFPKIILMIEYNQMYIP